MKQKGDLPQMQNSKADKLMSKKPESLVNEQSESIAQLVASDIQSTEKAVTISISQKCFKEIKAYQEAIKQTDTNLHDFWNNKGSTLIDEDIASEKTR